MKTSKVNSLKVLAGIAITCLTILFELSSCSNQKSHAEEKPNSTTQPEVDIHTAVLTDNVDALKQHIAAGSNLDERDPFGGSSPLITASLFDKPEAVQLLIDAGADVNFQNNDGSTALHVSSFFCRPHIVKVLLENGADKNIKNKFGATPYQSVADSFENAKGTYDMMGTMLAPMGLKLDYAHLQKTRPEIAAMLQ